MALDLQKYLTLYLAEAAEHLAAFSADLVRLEKAHGGEGEARPAPRPGAAGAAGGALSAWRSRSG